MLRARFFSRHIAHPADTSNVLIGFAAPLIVLVPFIFRSPVLVADIYGSFAFLFMGKSNYILHLHVHRPLCRGRVLNRLLELALGAATGMVASNWRIQHLYGHHRGDDTRYRGDRSWQLQKYTPIRALSYPLLSIVPTLVQPYVESFEKGVVDNIQSPMNYRWAFAEQTLLLLFLVSLAYWNLNLALFYLLPWYFCTHFITHYVDYLNHYGCDEDASDPYRRANNSINASFNAATHNFGYHTVHHLRPSAHWTELPEMHRQIADRIPAECLKPVSWSGLLLPYHLYLSLSQRM